MTEAVRQKIDRRLLWIGALLVLFLVFYGVRAATRQKLQLRAAEVTRSELVSQISTNGKVEPQTNFEAHSPISATVKELYVHEGDQVPAGKLLLQLDDTDARSHLAAALAALKGAQANYDMVLRGGTQDERLSLSNDLNKAKTERDQATRDLAALQRLQSTGAASPNEVAAAKQRLDGANASVANLEQRQGARYSKADLDHARASLADAQASYAAAQEVINQANVRAPFAGTVYSLPVSRTEFADQGKLLLQMANLSSIQVRAYFDEPELGKLALGQSIKIVWDARPGRAWHGHIARIPSTVITYGTRNVGEVLVAVDDSDGTLLPNTNVTVTVTIQSEKNVLNIPREALHTENGKAFVYVVRDEKLHRTPVTLGTINLTQVGIESGLNEHDVVALSSTSGQPLTDGAPSRIVK
ncbi:MAG TPA: efflux RND transporter periplasmic adaptor subunit [Acidisarcina sp.]|nr:efflux RND transporter periplasmic adaptor subunit [Acidisarcina sp.]